MEKELMTGYVEEMEMSWNSAEYQPVADKCTGIKRMEDGMEDILERSRLPYRGHRVTSVPLTLSSAQAQRRSAPAPHRHSAL